MDGKKRSGPFRKGRRGALHPQRRAQLLSQTGSRGISLTRVACEMARTNNELEQCFGSVRYGERRASGRRGAMVALVVRGPVRVLTALALRRQCFLPQALALPDLEAWYQMREHLTFRREARRKQLRFRKDPAAYLAALEEVLLASR